MHVSQVDTLALMFLIILLYVSLLLYTAQALELNTPVGNHNLIVTGRSLQIWGGETNSSAAVLPLDDEKSHAQTVTKIEYSEKGWSVKKTSLGVDASIAVACDVFEGNVYCAGGLSPVDHQVSTSLRIMNADDMQVASSNALGSFNPGRYDMGMAILNRKVSGVDTPTIYLFGGRSIVNGSQQYYNDLYAIDVHTKSEEFIRGTPKPAPRSNFCMSPLNSTSFLIYGGFDIDNNWGDSWIYDTSGGWQNITYIDLSTRPPPRNSMACTTINEKVYIFGGWIKNATSNELWSFDRRTLGWKRLSPDTTVPSSLQPSRRDASRMVGVGRYLVIYGGFTRGDCAEDGKFYFYDVEDNKWVDDGMVVKVLGVTGNGNASNGASENGQTSESSSKVTGGIIGGVVGGVAVCAVVLGALLIMRRRRLATAKEDGERGKSVGTVVDVHTDEDHGPETPQLSSEQASSSDATMAHATEASMPNPHHDPPPYTPLSSPLPSPTPIGTRHVCIAPHISKTSEELIIGIGDLIYVREILSDGWALGWNAISDKEGKFPVECVEICKVG